MAEEYNHKQDGSRSVSLNELTKDELVTEVMRLRGQLKKRNAFGLVFERQTEDAIINRASTIPVLKENKEKYVNNGGEDNLLLIGDNIDSLTCLLETHKGKIDVIYIDPPYNTGNEDFIYNDKYVNSEDSFRHSKWLSFMEVRLLLAKELLADNGVIFVSIDDNEVSNLKLLCDNVFGELNFISVISVVNNLKGRSDSKFIATAHENLIVFAKDINSASFNGFPLSEEQLGEYKLKDEKGFYKEVGLKKTGKTSLRSDRPNMFYPIYVDNITKKLSLDKDEFDDYEEVLPYINSKEGCWRWGKETFFKNKDTELTVKNTSNGLVINVKMRLDVGGGESRTIKPKSIWIDPKYDSGSGTRIIKEMFGENAFTNPKPLAYIKDIILISTAKDSIILDFFAGSGTTGHAVLELNKEDGGNRKFILCTNDEAGIGETITYERIKRVITGKDWADGKEHDSHEASLRYFNVQFANRDSNLIDTVTDNLDALVNIAEDTYNLVAETELYKVWNNKDNHYSVLVKDAWAIEDIMSVLRNITPTTVSVYVNDNGADYRSELSPLVGQGWDLDYKSVNNFVLDVIKYTDEILKVNSNEDSVEDVEVFDTNNKV